MKKEQDYIRDIAEIRSMMERSSKFLSLSGWAGIMAGIYALLGAFIAYRFFLFNPQDLLISGTSLENQTYQSVQMAFLGLIVLLMALGTAIYFSFKNAEKRGEKLWNPTSKRMLVSMLVPLLLGGLIILLLLSKSIMGLVAPLSLIFYGLALYNASRYTYKEVEMLAYVEMGLGLLGCYFIGYGLILWTLGFGVAHIIYGIFIHYRYEK